MADLVIEGSGVPLFVALPRRARPEAQLLVCVHGISRNAIEHLETFAGLAGGGCAIGAPLFNENQHRHYQKLGLGYDEPRADWALDAALDALSRQSGLSTDRFHLFGFSGGAQFAQRYAMLQPGRVRSLHLAAAGYYTFLDSAHPWPRGLRRAPQATQMHAARDFFLRLPIHVYVGEHDTERDHALRRGRRIDAQQGRHRVERARRWVEHIAGEQERLGPARVSLNILPDSDHDYVTACRPDAGDLARRVLAACGLLESAASPDLEEVDDDRKVRPMAVGDRTGASPLTPPHVRA